MVRTLRAPSPAMLVALVSLFVALAGTALAATPVVKRALFANNAGHLQGKTAAKVAAMPSPARTAKGLVSIVSADYSLNPSEAKDVPVSCPAGEKALAGGWDNPTKTVVSFDTRPPAENTWSTLLLNTAKTAATGKVYVVCIE
jgi:hypothetical protein